MCGIAGIISQNPAFVNKVFVKKMTDAIAHRGPDGEGYWSDENNVAFGHRRLAIIDLSDSAAQPMIYLNRYTIIYNGEIYNYKELRHDLLKQGYQFHTSSDTEVILAAYDCYKENCLSFFDGMFAFSIWDQKEKILFAARDRFGEKPFYYHFENEFFIFASEMKALWACGIDKIPEQKMMLNYLALGYVQNPSDKSQTFYKQIYSLPPGHYVTVKISPLKLSVVNYFDIDKQTIKKIDDNQAVSEILSKISSSVKMRLRSDVEVGLNLSGGLDSSTIAWHIKNTGINNKREFKTFSAVFPGFEKDESQFIKTVTSTLNLKNFSVTPDIHGLIEDFEKLMWHQEEPFPSSSIYAQYKVFELASKNGIKVLLDGQGADEVFGGYHKYMHWYLQEVFSRNRFLRFVKEKHAMAENKIPVNWGLKNIMAAYLPSHAAIALEKKEYNRILNQPFLSANLLSCATGREWEGINKPIITKLNDILYFNTMRNGLEEMLRFADRNSMAHGTEVRLPFLQANLVNFVFSLPSKQKIFNGFPKWILRKAMDKKLPNSIIWRTDKTGFEPPQKNWMNTSAMDNYIFEAKKKLVKEDILKPTVLNKKSTPMDAHSADNFDWRYLCVAGIVS